jgi:hypothetical protein
MKRIGLACGIVLLGIALYAFVRREPSDPPSVVFGQLSPSWPGKENEERDELRRRGAAVVPVLVEAMRHRSLAERVKWNQRVAQLPSWLGASLPRSGEYAFRRRTATWMLGELGPVASNAVPALEKYRASVSDPDLKAQAIIALAKIQPGNPFARSNLLAELRAGSQTPRFFVAQELGAFPSFDAELVSLLATALNDPDGEVRANATWSASQFGPVARAVVPRLRELLHDPYRHTSVNAAYALVRIAPDQAPEAVDTFRALLEKGAFMADTTAPLLALSLGPSATNAIPWLEECLRRHKGAVTEQVALVALWRIRRQATPEMLEFLPLLDQPAAIRALGELGPLAAAAEPRLRELTTDSRLARREAAAEALRQIRPATAAP